MFLNLFSGLRDKKVPVSITEYLDFLGAVDQDLISHDLDHFYLLARTILVKDEKHYDRFDQVFSLVFKGVTSEAGLTTKDLPEDWLKSLSDRYFTEEEKAKIEALGGFDALMDALKKRLAEQEGRHEGGNRWIGTRGTSPFGADGYNPEGVRIGQATSRHQRAVKVWDRREFKNLDDSVALGTRNIKVALRRLRKFARQGAHDELDLDGTIASTARQGYLDVVLRPERRNTIKLLLLFDVGGSMDPHITLCEELFSAARSEFKHLEFFYFHNCVYEGVWKDNRRRQSEVLSTFDLIHRYPKDWRLVLIGDASMSPYDIAVPGGSVEHWNEESGAVWLQRLFETFPHAAWLNPVSRDYWDYTRSISMVRDLIGPPRMFPLTISGLEAAMRELSRK